MLTRLQNPQINVSLAQQGKRTLRWSWKGGWCLCFDLFHYIDVTSALAYIAGYQIAY